MVRSIKKKKRNYSLNPFILFTLFIIGIAITFFVANKKERHDTRSLAATPIYNRILWQNNNWFVHGVNVPWYNWGCDFGCNATIGRSGGVSTNLSTLRQGFQKAKDAGMHAIRWWVFPGDPWQINRDINDVPTGINTATYTDIDAALSLAEEYDIYYNFVLFSAPTAMPSAWMTDIVKRQKLADALGVLFSKYASHPRIMSWEIYNEPENDIWNNRISEQPVVDTGTLIAQTIHEKSPGTLVTVGSLFADGMKMWMNSGLDYYSPHWYDYMSNGGYCIYCNDYNYYAAWGINKPIVVGEFYTGNSSTNPTSAQRLDHWYQKGYAGAWGWSLFPERTSDRMEIDFAAATTFASMYSDLGPRAGVVVNPTSVATPTTATQPTATPTTTLLNTPTPTLAVNNFYINNLKVSSITRTTASIRFTTTRLATNWIEYGTSATNLSMTTTKTTQFVSSHAVTISGLARNTRYYYKVHATDEAGNEIVSGLNSFRTKR